MIPKSLQLFGIMLYAPGATFVETWSAGGYRAGQAIARPEAF